MNRRGSGSNFFRSRPRGRGRGRPRFPPSSSQRVPLVVSSSSSCINHSLVEHLFSSAESERHAGRENMYFNLRKAARSIEACLFPIRTVVDAKQCRHVGEKIASTWIGPFLALFETPPPPPVPPSSSSSSSQGNLSLFRHGNADLEETMREEGDGSREREETSESRSCRSRQRAYVPRSRSAAYALLVGLIAASFPPRRAISLAREDLVLLARSHTDTEMEPRALLGSRSRSRSKKDGFDVMETTLIRKGLVQPLSKHDGTLVYLLSESGFHLAYRLYSNELRSQSSSVPPIQDSELVRVGVLSMDGLSTTQSTVDLNVRSLSPLISIHSARKPELAHLDAFDMESMNSSLFESVSSRRILSSASQLEETASFERLSVDRRIENIPRVVRESESVRCMSRGGDSYRNEEGSLECFSYVGVDGRTSLERSNARTKRMRDTTMYLVEAPLEKMSILEKKFKIHFADPFVVPDPYLSSRNGCDRNVFWISGEAVPLRLSSAPLSKHLSSEMPNRSSSFLHCAGEGMVSSSTVESSVSSATIHLGRSFSPHRYTSDDQLGGMLNPSKSNFLPCSNPSEEIISTQNRSTVRFHLGVHNPRGTSDSSVDVALSEEDSGYVEGSWSQPISQSQTSMMSQESYRSQSHSRPVSLSLAQERRIIHKCQQSVVDRIEDSIDRLSRTSLVRAILTSDDFRVTLLVDHRERTVHAEGLSRARVSLADYLSCNTDVPVRETQLQLGDFAWVLESSSIGTEDSNSLMLSYIVERKAGTDMALSMLDSRAMEQRQRLRHCGLDFPSYLVEDIRPSGSISSSSVLKYCSSLELVEGFHVHYSASIESSARYLTAMTQYLQKQTDRIRDQIANEKLLHRQSCVSSNLPPSSWPAYRISTSLIEKYLVQFIDPYGRSLAEFSAENAKGANLTSAHVFERQLASLPQVSSARAKAIMDLYPSPMDLYHALSVDSSETASSEIARISQLRPKGQLRDVGVGPAQFLYHLFSQPTSYDLVTDS